MQNELENEGESSEQKSFVESTTLYREFLAEREEILRHKWIESQKAGRDIGFEKALLDWIMKHRSNWRRARHPKPMQQGNGEPS